MPGPISTIHLPASQSSPPTQHLPGDSLSFPDPPAPLVFPVDPADISNTDSGKVTHLWPSCVPLFTFAEHSCLQERKDRIIQVLKLSKNKRLGNNLQTTSDHVLKHNQYTETFSEETCMLDFLLTSVFACTTFTKDVVYKLDEKIYRDLHTLLTTRHALASSSLNSFGYSDLRPPGWAIDTVKGLMANDFELYAFQYRIRVEHFLHMLDYVYDWNKLQTRVYLDEKMLAAQRNADRARLEKREYYLPAVPPVSHSNPFKSKTSVQASASDLSWGGVHYDASRDEEQPPSSSQVAKICGQSCLCVNSKVSEPHDFGPYQHESLPAASHQAQIPKDLDCRNPSSHTSIYRGRSPSDLDSGQGCTITDGNKHQFRRDSCYSKIPTCSDLSEYTSIDFDTALKATDIPAYNSNPNTRDNCGNKFIITPTLNHNIGNPIIPYSNNNGIRTFQIASNTPCAPFSEKNKNSRLPRKIRYHIDRLQRQLQRIIHATSCVTSTNSDCQRILMGMRECILWLSGFTIMGSEATRVPVGVNTPDLDTLQMVLNSGSYIMCNSQTALQMLSMWPRVRIKQKTNLMKQTGTKCRLQSQCLVRHGIKVEFSIVPPPIDWELRVFEVHALAEEVVSQSTKIARLQSYHTQKSGRHSKHRRVPGTVRAKIWLGIPAKLQPTVGHDNQFLDVSLTSSTNAPMIPITLEAMATERDTK
ncbi:uncharacterized protein EV420DRAFT_1482297 [Desarmillaria tabescens]|uniref:Uncharacterized protein n=1 Tax=Armillaria tabescens TaxID=1929756 RepID=A0AA39K1Y9_ARMTA|nr:uncharacterized protein EV420DRAFT_1482297 [Desarmillaria tabescens]KAK0451950.1 hypothetical protein EV420DRAFT_1482297 [Desarmillaria tabescens]